MGLQHRLSTEFRIFIFRARLRYRVMLELVFRMVPPFAVNFATVFIIYYVYALLGVGVFHGKILKVRSALCLHSKKVALCFFATEVNSCMRPNCWQRSFVWFCCKHNP
jgi:hypothetical protein